MVRDTSNLTKFVESASIDRRLIKEVGSEELKESLSRVPARLVESVSGDSSKGWWVPISHYGNYKNGNGRIYNTKLWENVINNQKDSWFGSPMLCDHPSGDSDGNPKDICGVWLDAKFGPAGSDGIGIVYGLLVPSGHYGQDLQDHLQNGLKVGTSSSGFGKLMRDGMTVDPDTYQIERLADWVLCPSQSTFFSWDESNNEIEDKSFCEALENNNEKVIESLDNTTIKEKVVKDSKFTKLEEKKFRRDMESFLESADNIKDPQERLNEFKEIKSYLEEGICPDLKEKVEAKILEEETNIKTLISESIQIREEFGVESPKELKAKVTDVLEKKNLSEKEAKDWKVISEQLQEKLAQANKTIDQRPTMEFTEFQKNKITSLKEQMSLHDKKAKEVLNKLADAYKKMCESCESMEEQIKGLVAERDGLQKQLEEECFGRECAEQAKIDIEEKCGKVEKSLKESNEAVAKLKDLYLKQKVQLEESIKDVKELKALNEKTNNRVNTLAKEASTAQMKIRKDALKRAQESRSELTDTERYYEELYREYGNEVRSFKEQIANARSLAEAKRFFFKNVLDNLGESQKIREMRKPSMILSEKEVKSDETLKNEINGDMIDRLPDGWK